MGRTAMSTKELRRVSVMGRVTGGTLSLRDGARLLGVSYRQMKRIAGRYRSEGAAGLTHRSVGRPSNRARPGAQRETVLALVREKYSGTTSSRFGPTLAAEHLASEDGLTVDHETLRRWLLAAGLWSRARKRSPHRQRRVPKAHFGELLQLDGSFHHWFEERGPACCLLTLVDDATGRSLGRFSAQETIWAAVGVLRAWIGAYGIPQALYTDWKNVYVRPPTESERLAETVPHTQFGRMCAELGIQIIAANSPQAKGRIERNHGTHQDRLVKKLRRLGVRDQADANAWLEQIYWTDHNRRFAHPPASDVDFHLAAPRASRLDQIFRLESRRTVSNDWVVRYDNRYFQIDRQTRRPPARSTVQIYEAVNGAVEIQYRDHPMRMHELSGADVLALRTTAPRADAAASVAPASAAPKRLRPVKDHPWRQMIHFAAQDGLARKAKREQLRAGSGDISNE
jgi:transposase